MIPLRDVVPSRTVPAVTLGLIAVNALAFLFELSLPGAARQAFLREHGVVPAHLSAAPLVTSMFLHGGWLHLLGNMWFLWIFGDNVEDRLGHLRYLAFYLLSGVAAALVQALAAPESRVPIVGASGAIAAVMGAYLVLYPRSRVLTLVPIIVVIEIIEIPAVWFLGFWFLLQFVVGAASLSAGAGREGVAWWAHVGGFVAGAGLQFVFRKRGGEWA